MSKTPAHWQRRGFPTLLLMPVAWLFGVLAWLRRCCYQAGLCRVQASIMPVFVVGNISVGGTGKTPLTQALVKLATQQGIACGIVSRGHGGETHKTPCVVTDDSSAASVGDEPLLHHLKSAVPVVVCVDRSAAVGKLAQLGASIAISDDGLQHYAMPRALEVVVVDGEAGFSNALLLPAGPLREPIKRLSSVDIIAVQVSAIAQLPNTASLLQQRPELRDAETSGVVVGSFALQAQGLRHLWTNERLPLNAMAGRSVNAVAGIGAPMRFFKALQSADIVVTPREFVDHHSYHQDDFKNMDNAPVIVTGKDAVKLSSLALQSLDIYELEVEVILSDELDSAINLALQKHAQL